MHPLFFVMLSCMFDKKLQNWVSVHQFIKNALKWSLSVNLPISPPCFMTGGCVLSDVVGVNYCARGAMGVQ